MFLLEIIKGVLGVIGGGITAGIAGARLNKKITEHAMEMELKKEKEKAEKAAEVEEEKG